VNPCSSLGVLRFVAQADARLALHEKQHGRFRRRVFGEFLALAEAEDHGLDLVVLEDRAAENLIGCFFLNPSMS
jgi:hypothetical protein